MVAEVCLRMEALYIPIITAWAMSLEGNFAVLFL